MKVKKLTMEMLIVAMIMIAFMVMFPKAVNAAVSYTKTVTANDGSIEINLKGLTLDEEKTYSFALVEKAKTPESWVEIRDYTTTTAKVVLNPSTQAIKDVLKKTDTGYLYVKDNSVEDGTYVVEKLQVDLKLPLLQAVSYKYEANGWYTINQVYDAIGDKYSYMESNTYYQYVKVTDKNLIEKYLKIKNSKGDVTTLESSLPSAPTTGYNKGSYISGNNKNDGLYLLWVKLTGTDTKDVYGCIIHDGLPKATKVDEYIPQAKVQSISVISPNEGTYPAPQTVQILVRFSDHIKGSTAPTLKIKFGEGKERTLTNGTIKNDYFTTSDDGAIIYTYNIQADDKGQLAAVSLTGGNLTDELGNEVKLSCPVITGNAIKANTEVQANNQTQNDKDKTPSTDNNQGSSSTNKPSETTTNNNNSNSKDDTTVKGNLPQTGVNETIIGVIAVVAVIGGVLYVRYRKMRDII